MSIRNRTRLNRNFDGGTGLANVHGDRFRPEDYIIDKTFLQGRLGDILQLISKAPSIISGLVVSQGAGDTINITSGSALIYDNQTPDITGHDYDGSALSPDVTVEPYISAILYSGVSNQAIGSATLDGGTTNYVKFSLSDSLILQRGPAKDPGTPYDVFQKEDVTLTVDSTPPAANELLLATFIGSAGGSFTFSSDPDSGERDYDYGLEPANGKIYVPVAGLEVHKTGSTIKTALVFNPAADRNIQFPDKDGVLALLSDVGGGGSGFSPIVSGFNESAYVLVSLTEFPVNGTHSIGNSLVDGGTTTATEDVADNDYYEFDTVQDKVVSSDMTSSELTGRATVLNRAQAVLRWAADSGRQDPVSRIRVSRNNGVAYADVADVRQLGLKEGDFAALAEYDDSNQDSNSALNVTTQTRLGQGFQVSDDSIPNEIDLYLKRVGTPGGRYRASIRSDDSAVPHLTDVLAVTDWFQIDDVDTSGFFHYRMPLLYSAKLTSGVQYHVVLELEDIEEYDFASTTSELQWGGDTSSPSYTLGQASIGDGSSFTGVAGADRVFTINGHPIIADSGADISSGEVIFDSKYHYSRNAELIVYGESNGDSDLELNGTTQQQIGQMFQLDERFAVTRVEMRLKRTGAPGGQLQAHIYDDDSGAPGSLLATSLNKINADAVSTSEEYRSFKFDGVELDAETAYWFVLDGVSGYSYSGSTKIEFRADGSSPTYLSGAGINAFYNGSTWSASTSTLIFKILGAYQDESLISTYDKANESTNQIDIDDGTARERLGQAVSLPANTIVDRVDLLLARIGSPGGNCYVELYSDSGGEPDTLLSTSEELSIDDLSTSAEFVRFDFIKQLKLSASTTYWVVLRVTSDYSYTDTIDEIQWFRDPSSPYHPGGNTSAYASATWTPSATTVHVYKLYGYESHLIMEIYGRKLNSRLSGFGLWYLFDRSYVIADENLAVVSLTSDMIDSGAVPYAPIRVAPGLGTLQAIIDHSTYVGGVDFLELDNVAQFDPAVLAGQDTVVFQKIVQGVSFADPVYQLQDRLRCLPDPVLVRHDAETIELQAPGAISFKVELGDGTVCTAPHGLRVSFNAAKNQLGGIVYGGVEASDTEYYLYAVKYPGSTRSVGVVIDTVKPSAGGPTGYRFWKYLGRFWNDGSSNIIYPFKDEVILDTEVDHGSAPNYITHFANVTTRGTLLQAVQSSVNGDYIENLMAGTVGAVFRRGYIDSGTRSGISINASSLTTALATLAFDEVLCFGGQETSSGFGQGGSGTIWAAINSKIRLHHETTTHAISTPQSEWFLRVTLLEEPDWL